MNKKTNKFIQSQVTGGTMKVCWSMLWQRKTLTIADVLKKGCKENSIRVAFARLVKEGWAVKPSDTKNLIEIAKDVTK